MSGFGFEKRGVGAADLGNAIAESLWYVEMILQNLCLYY